MPPFGPDHRQVANELNAVSEALLGVEQDCLAGQILATPLRLREFAWHEFSRAAPPPFIAAPALREIADREAQERLVPMRFRQLRLERDGAIEAIEGLLRTVEIAAARGRD